jgi:hypothetical protein
MTTMTQGPVLNASPSGWLGDFLDRDTVLPGGIRVDAAQFNGYDAVVVDVGAAGAAIGATTVPVGALSGPIPTGTVLWFSGGKFVHLTAAAAAGATSLAVTALPTALVDADVATYPGIDAKLIVNGTLVGRTFTERAANTDFGPAADADDEVFILVHDVTDAAKNPEAEALRPGALVKENFLPQWATMSAALKAKIRATYVTTTGVA